MLYPTVYSILVRWGPEWDGQSVTYTESKALFELLERASKNIYFSDFSEKLQQELISKHSELDWDAPYDPGALEDIDIARAIEYLEYTGLYPVLVIDHTEFTLNWNW